MQCDNNGLTLDVAANYEPLGGETLFHYCPSESFWAILESRTLWLSSIYSLNDGFELQWGRQLARDEMSKDTIEFRADFRFAVLNTFAEAHKRILPLVFSLSKHGDLLSQWKGYAADGEGFAIQFDGARVAAAFPGNMKKVLYETDQQVLLVRNTLRLFASWWRKNNDAGRRAVLEVLPDFAIDLISLKHPSFFEEQEIRMVHLLTQSGDSLTDPGGHTELEPGVEGQQVKQRIRGDDSIPYIALPFPDATAVAGVVLGPKNPCSDIEVKRKLATLGFDRLPVTRSSSPYR